ncbi:MAG: hypothetical protein RRY11_06065 [Terrisporobacter sp.]
MKNKLIDLNGIDHVNVDAFKWKLEESLEGEIEFSNKTLTGATISKEILNHKVINSFQDINNDGLEIFNNILTLNIKFNLAIEYCENTSFGKLNLLNFVFYKTFFTSLENYNFDNLENNIFIEDFYLLENEDVLNYYIDIIIGTKEM